MKKEKLVAEDGGLPEPNDFEKDFTDDELREKGLKFAAGILIHQSFLVNNRPPGPGPIEKQLKTIFRNAYDRTMIGSVVWDTLIWHQQFERN
jgi:hypothetical protein